MKTSSKVEMKTSSKVEMEKLLETSISVLMEHFEAVQILVSRSTPEETQSIFSGRGNWFARQGMAREFITENESRTMANELSETINSDNSGESWNE